MEGKESWIWFEPPELMSIISSGFNMENSLAKFVTYAAFLVDGNPVTNLMSIGGKSSLTGQDPPSPAIVGGLDTHAVFEGWFLLSNIAVDNDGRSWQVMQAWPVVMRSSETTTVSIRLFGTKYVAPVLSP